MSAALDKGKWAEKQARDWMEARSAKVAAFVYHRYPDAKAARGALAAQPADYLVSANKVIYHLETKETKQINRLPKGKIKQFGQLLKWWIGGITPYVVIYRSETQDWAYLGPNQLFSLAECPPSFDLTQRPKFDTCNDVLTHLFAS